LSKLRSILGRFKRGRREEGKGEDEVLRAVARVERRITFSDIFIAFSLAFFDKPGRWLARTFEFNRLFARAGLNIHPEKYGAIIMTITTLSTIFSVTSFILLHLFFKLNLIALIIGVATVVLIPILAFTSGLMYPYLAASSRRVQTENELPFFMVYVATMARGGFSLEKVIERVAQLRVFNAIRRESQRVITRMKTLGEDPVSALEHVSLNHPYTRFRDVILGYTTTLKSGGDVLHYLEIRTRELLEARAAEVKAIIGRLTTYLELYTIFGVVLSVTLFVFFSVQAAISAAQAAGRPGEMSVQIDVTFPAIYNFIALPLIGFSVLFALHMSQPRTPISYREVYFVLLEWVPVSMVVFIVVLIATGGAGLLYGKLGLRELKSLLYAVAASIVTASLPPALKYRSIIKRQRGLVRSMADFLRDLSELRKTGLSPERCIILVSSRSYRNLTPVVQRASSALSIGLDLEESLKRALRGIKEWFVIASFRFLVDSIIVGGGSPEIIETLARFTQSLSEVEEETRRRMRTQAVLPYFGAIMLASMPIIILYMLLALARLPITTVTPMVYVLAEGSIINSYIMGMVAGKASQTTLAAGFLHATILTLVSVATLLGTLTFIGV
jgi:flagellar protein FlaJ